MAITGEEVLEKLASLVAEKSMGSLGSARAGDGEAARIKADEELAKAMKEVADGMKAMGVKQYESKEELDKELAALEKIAKRANTSLEKLGVKATKTSVGGGKLLYFINNQIKVTEDLTEKSEDLADAVEKDKEAFEKHTTTSKLGKAAMSRFTTGLKHMSKEFLKYAEQEQRFAQQTATADAGWIDGMYSMGISQIEYMKLLKETRVEGMAATNAGVGFKKSLEDSQHSLRGLTANYEEAAKVSGMFHKNMARMGVSQAQLGDAVLQQTTIYEKNYRALGYTAEQFASLTEELINDQGMRTVLLTLQEKERKQYILGIQQRMVEYQTMGYTIERAKELQKTFQNLVGMDPKERMKQAAKKRAMMGAMGMGTEGEELFRLETTYRTMNAEQKAAADIRMTEIQKQGAKIFGEISGSGVGLGQSMAMQMMAQKTGFDKVAETFQVETGLGLKISKDQLDKTNEIAGYLKTMLGVMDYWGAMEQSAMGSLLTNTLKGLAGLGALIVGTIGLGKIAGGIGKMGGKALGGIGKMGGKALGIGSMFAGKGAKAAAGATKAAAGLGKTAIKSGIKKIPLIGALAALGFAASRVMDGDIFGAGMEVASGVASVVPGIGTAASVGIDAALLARDVAGTGNVEKKLKTVSETTTTTSTTPTAPPQDTVAAQLLSTLEELQTYLKSINQQNSEQAMAVAKTATAITESTRFGSINRSSLG